MDNILINKDTSVVKTGRNNKHQICH